MQAANCDKGRLNCQYEIMPNTLKALGMSTLFTIGAQGPTI